jgi:hypothetical protein
MRGLVVKHWIGIVALASVVLSTDALALHRQTPFMLTLSCKSQADPLGTCVPNSVSSNPFCQGSVARWIAFESVSDLMGNGSSGSEIFLFDNEPPRSLSQVTNAATGDSHNPSTDSNAGIVAFDSSSDFLHKGLTARQIFAWDKKTTAITQITMGTADSIKPKVSASGNVIAFQSSADLIGSGATGSNIYYWQPSPFCDFNGCRYIRQVTSGPGLSENVVIGGGDSGPLLLFNSNAPVTGFSNGFQQIYMYERSTNHRIQLTDGNGDSIKASTDQTGRLVLFQSQADLLNNGSSGWELFLLDRQTGILRQLTNSPTGDSFNSSLGGGDRFVIFVSTSDLKSTGSTGQHLFLYDLIYEQLYQVTKSPTGDSDHPVATANTIFFFDSTEDPMNLGLVGRFTYGLNVFGLVPLLGTGPGTFKLQPGQGSVGSNVRITTRDAVTTVPIGSGQIAFNVTGFDYDGQSGMQVKQEGIQLPPVPVPSFGAVCFTPSGNGTGVIDCKGGKPGLDVTALQDHDTGVTQDPLCLAGCRENDASCQGQLLGPHFDQCGKCGLGTCSAGANVGLTCLTNAGCPDGECLNRVCDIGIHVGEACTVDTDCSLSSQCVGGQIPVCNGPVSTETSGAFGAGDAAINIPLTAKLSVDPGVDGKFCTGDDTYKLTGIGATLRLTTGVATAGIIDADDVTNEVIGASEEGAPFNCPALLNKDVTGTRLVGAVSFLDVPTIPGLRDVILSWRFQAYAPPCTANCPQPCTVDADCNDGNACNGPEACVSGNCASGAPVVCSDGNACNGVETCNPVDGSCSPGAAPNCDDGNPCTDDSCDFFFGCRHNPNTNTCDDGNLCTTGDACFGGLCNGAPVACTDNNVCNGLETCDPGTGGCLVGTPLNCDDNNTCTADSCNSASGCYHTSIAGSCDDGDLCTTGDTCAAGTCVGVPVVCTNGDPCDGLETCDPGTGGCLLGTPLVCNDNNACTDDACVPGVGCVFTNNTNPCDDLSACTTGDVCSGGLCAGTLTPAAVTCNAGNGDPCDGDELCDPATGACGQGTPPSCDDNNTCTDDSCVPFTGCVNTPNDANACTDNNLCTTDTCAGGTCVATPVACSNNDACDGLETCNAGTGACDPGTPLQCDDFIACTTDSCDALLGCQHGLPAGIPGTICLLDQMRATLVQAPRGSVAPKLSRRLERMIDRTQALLNDALTTGLVRQLDLVKAGQRRFTQIIRVTSRALPRGRHATTKIVAAVANPLMDDARTGRAALAALALVLP